MKLKTARRFLSRNAWKMAYHRRIYRQKPSFLKRWRTATYIVITEG